MHASTPHPQLHTSAWSDTVVSDPRNALYLRGPTC